MVQRRIQGGHGLRERLRAERLPRRQLIAGCARRATRLLLVAPLALAALLPCEASAQASLPPGVRGAPAGAATRGVTTYVVLERALADALHAGDRAAAQQMLAPDFVARMAGSNADGLAGDEWLERALHGRPSGLVRELAVDEFGDVAVVSFLLDERRTAGGRTIATTRYVVDVWRVSARQLAARYVAPPSRATPPPVRPGGRE